MALNTTNKHQILLYFALAYLISWLIWLPLVAASQNWVPADAPFTLIYAGTIGPTLAAVILLWLDQGLAGVWLLAHKLVLWRVRFKWYLIALLLPAIIRSAAVGLLYLFGNIRSEFSFKPTHELLGIVLLMMVLVPFEEMGWRGFALPRLQVSYGPLLASLILGVFWSVWHLPLIWVQGSYQESRSPLTYILVFTVTILPISVLFTWIYNHTNGSLLLASLFHCSINITESALIIRDDDGLSVLIAACLLYCIAAAIMIIRWQTYRGTATPVSRVNV